MTFVHVPKTAGTSFTRWVVNNEIPHENMAMHATAERVRQMWTDPGLVFAFVRNPYDRLVSYFNYVGQQSQRKLQAHAQGHMGKKRIDVDLEHSILRIYRAGFYYWLTQEASGKPTAMSRDKTFVNWRMPQVTWTKDADRVIKVEELCDQFAWIQGYFRCASPLPRDNTSERGAYQDYYNRATRRIVVSMYEQDLDEFGYVF